MEIMKLLMEWLVLSIGVVGLLIFLVGCIRLLIAILFQWDKTTMDERCVPVSQRPGLRPPPPPPSNKKKTNK